MKFLLAFAAVCLGLWTFVHFAFPDYSHRFRITIEVETPEGPKSGSSVMESYLQDNSYLPLPGRSHTLHFKGEAVFVDLGQGRNLVGTLEFGNYNDDFIATLALRAWGLYGAEKSWSTISHAKGRKILTNGLIPILVSFADLNDPKSVRLVPHGEADRVLDPGFRITAVWIEMTGDRTTRAIKSRLPWLEGFKGLLGGQMQRDPKHIEKNLTANDFRRG